MTNQPVDDITAFSLVEGGPTWNGLRRAGLVGPALSRSPRRIAIIVAVAWLPLLLLAAAEQRLWGTSLSFLSDVEAHARLLVALPVLIYAEVLAHERLGDVIAMFQDRQMIAPADMGRFEEALARARRLRDSRLAEVVLLILVYSLGNVLWRRAIATHAGAWYGSPSATGGLDLTAAGRWFAWVSIPLFQFVLLRWYYRLFIWYQLLWRMSRLPLRLQATHPDRVGGLGFINRSLRAFSAIAFALGVMLSGLMATKILGEGKRLPDFSADIVGLVLLTQLVFLAPLLMFLPLLRRARADGVRRFGRLATQYSLEFDRKWLRGNAPGGESPLGSGDIQSLADLGNAYRTVSDMRPVPIRPRVVLWMFFVTLVPLAPLLLTLLPVGQLVDWLIGRLL